jgi:hypothetical protein
LEDLEVMRLVEEARAVLGHDRVIAAEDLLLIQVPHLRAVQPTSVEVQAPEPRPEERDGWVPEPRVLHSEPPLLEAVGP